MIEVYGSRQAAAGGTNAEDKIYVMNAVVNFVQGMCVCMCVCLCVYSMYLCVCVEG